MSGTKTVLVVGATGFVGTHTVNRLRQQFKVFATYRTHPMAMQGVTYLPLAIENRPWAKRLVRAIAPDVIVYCAGPYDPEWAESHPDDADNVFTSGVSVLAEASSIIPSKFIYLSTAYTFDGKKGNYHETDTPLPQSSFGRLKLSGENYVKTKTLNWVSIRSSPVFGRGTPEHPSFLDKLRMRLDREQAIELSPQHIHSFASVDDLSELVASLVDSTFRNKIIHFGGLTKLSYFEFGQEFARHFGFSEKLVTVPQLATKMDTREKEAEDFSLNSSQALSALKLKPLLLQESFDLLQKKLIPIS